MLQWINACNGAIWIYFGLSNELIVHTRKKEKEDGIWSAVARWGDKTFKPQPYYIIAL